MLNKIALQRLLHRFGWHLSRYLPSTNGIARRKHILGVNKIDTVLDVGANVGQYVAELRHDIGYTGQIISFEPLDSAFEMLHKQYMSDSNWIGVKLALGASDFAGTINVSENLHSSSLDDMLSYHRSIDPSSRYMKTQNVQVRSLDGIIDYYSDPRSSVLLKLDVQGYEKQVLEGAVKSMARLKLIQLELSLQKLYANELTINEMLNLMYGYGYRLVSIEAGFADHLTGELVQVDGLFKRLHD